MKKIVLTTLEKSARCPIMIGQGIVSRVRALARTQRFSQIVILTDENVAPFWLAPLKQALKREAHVIVIKPGERGKSVETVIRIWEELMAHAFDRSSLLINMGGGVVGDIGAFAASTYLRGIAFLQIPTTLLAQADASVGGKGGVNFGGLKNMVGTFAQPIGVLIDINTLSTLPGREFISAFGEIIKHGLISDKAYLRFVTSKAPRNFSPKALEAMIERSCKIKAKIVGNDERESSSRKLLNFGHTVGHAIEALSIKSKTPLLHGEAVSIGILAEARISQAKGFIEEGDVMFVERSLASAGLPIKADGYALGDVMRNIKGDKKSSQGEVRWTLLKAIGKAVIDQDVEESAVEEAVASVFQ